MSNFMRSLMPFNSVSSGNIFPVVLTFHEQNQEKKSNCPQIFTKTCINLTRNPFRRSPCLVKLQTCSKENFRCFDADLVNFFQNIFFEKHLRTAASSFPILFVANDIAKGILISKVNLLKGVIHFCQIHIIALLCRILVAMKSKNLVQLFP